MSRIKIPNKAKVRVYWDDRPENYSREEINKIKNQFANVYGIHRNSVNVIFRPIKKDAQGNIIQTTGVGIDNIMDINYQHQLFKEWLKREDKKVDFERLVNLDKKVNEAINFKPDEFNFKSWSLKHLVIDNFLCFGDNNTVNFDKLKGVNVITSDPLNQGGKTTFSIDALLFLFFGTTTKTDKNEDIFNQFSGKNQLLVRGMIEIDGEEFIIERTMKRSAKRDGSGYTIKNEVKYYEVLPDGEEKELVGEHAPETTKKIVSTIGTESDFMTTILATANNLEELVETQATARGKLLTRFIGLEIIEQKENAVRAMYNDFAKKMKSNTHNIIDLSNEIEEHNSNIETIETALSNNEKKLLDIREELVKLNGDKVNLIGKKQKIDETIIQLDPTKLNKEIKDITEKGTTEKENRDAHQKRIDEIGSVSFDEVEYEEKLTQERTIKLNISADEKEIERLEGINIELENSEVCPTCKRALDGIDNSGEINKNKDKVKKLNANIKSNKSKLSILSEEIAVMKNDKALSEEKDKLEVKRDRCDVEIKSLRDKLKSKNNDLKKYNENVDAIESNRKIDVEIMGVDGKILRNEGDKDILIGKIGKCKTDIEQNKKDIESKTKIIETIKKEDQVEKIYKIYIDMVGKKGISKLVLRSVLPIINFELHRLLDEVVDFELELEINSKNDVDFVIVKNGVRKNLKSGSGLEKTAASLALRCVLGRVSNLPKPNFIGFDEVFGKVATENLEYIKLLVDKIRDMFDIVLLITHNTIVKDWADNIITIKKTNDISTITTK